MDFVGHVGSFEVSSQVYLCGPKSQITTMPGKSNAEHAAPSIPRLLIQTRKHSIAVVCAVQSIVPLFYIHVMVNTDGP